MSKQSIRGRIVRKIRKAFSFSAKLIVLTSFLFSQLLLSEIFLYWNNPENANVARAAGEITFVSEVNTPLGHSTPLVAAPTVTHHEGNLIAVFLAAYGQSSDLSVTDTQGNTYVGVGTGQTSVGGVVGRWFYTFASETSSNMVTGHVDSGYNTIRVVEFSGVSPTDTVDTYVSGTGTSTPAFTTSYANDLVLASFHVEGVSTLSAGSGYTLAGTAGTGIVRPAEYQVASSILTDATATVTTDGNIWGGWVAAFKGAGYTISGPDGGAANNASENFTVTPVDNYTGTITITPSGGGLDAEDAVTLTFSDSSTPQTFTITPTSAGTVTLTPSNNGGLADFGPVTFDVAASNATAYTLTADSSSGYVNATSENFTVTPNGYFNGTITITPSGGGLSTPIELTFSSSVAQTFTITPTSAGTVTLTPADSGTLTDPSAVTYVANTGITRISSSYSGIGDSNTSAVTHNEGNLIAVYFAVFGLSGTLSITDTQGNTYVPVGTQYTSSSLAVTGQWFYTFAGETSSNVVTGHYDGGGYQSIQAIEYSGVDPNDPVDTYANGGSVTNITSNFTTSNDHDLVLAGWHGENVSNLRGGLGYSLAGTYSDGLVRPVIQRETSATLTDSYATIGTDTGNFYGSWLVAFKAASDNAATSYTLTAPSPASGIVNAASENFTVTPDGAYTGTITITPSGGGLDASDAVTLTFDGSSDPQTFTITPTSAGTVTLAPTNDGGLTNPSSVTYIAHTTSERITNGGFEINEFPNPSNVADPWVMGDAYVIDNTRVDELTGSYGVEIDVSTPDVPFSGIYQQADLTGVTSLTFRYKLDYFENNGSGNVSVIAMVDETQVYSEDIPWSTPYTSWRSRTVDISGYAGLHNVQIAFSINGEDENYAGAFFDDISAIGADVTPLTAISDITGTLTVGSTLTAGALTPEDATATYQWSQSDTSDGTYSNITGATSSTYTLQASDEGKYIKVSATGSGSYTGTVTSNATGQVQEAAATTYTLTAPSPASGDVNSASEDFTVTPDGAYTGTITITPSGGGLDASDAVTLTFSNSSAAQTFTITPTLAGTVTLTPTNSSTLTDPSAVTYTANALSSSVELVSSVHTTVQSSGSTVIIAPEATHHAGNLIAAFVIACCGSTASGVTDTQGNTYTAVGSPQTIGAYSITGQWFYAFANSTSTNTVTGTYTADAAFRSIRVMEFSGIDTTDPVDVSIYGDGDTTSAFSTDTASEAIAVVWHVEDMFTSCSAGTGYTLDGSGTSEGDPSRPAEYRITTSTLTNSNASITIGDGWVGGYWLISFRGGGEVPAATSYTLTAPTPASGVVNAASENFTVTPNGAYTGTVTITPSGGGLDASDAVTLTFDNSSTPQAFTITPTSAGTVTLTPTNSGTLTNPSAVTYTASSTDITLVSSTSLGVNGSSGTSVSANAVTHTQGNLIAVFLAAYANTGDMSVTDTQGNTYVGVGSQFALNSPAVSGRWFYTFAGETSSNVVTGHFNGSYYSIRVLEYSGIDTGDPVDTYASGNGSTTPAFTTTSPKDLVLAAFHLEGGTDCTAGSGYSLLGECGSGVTRPAEERITSSILTDSTATITSVGGSVYGGWLVAFKGVSYTFTAPSPASGGVGSASGNFTVTPNAPYSGTITITPSGGGLSDPIVLTFDNSNTPQTFTITPTSAGTVTLTPTNNGGLSDPDALTYTAADPATTYTLDPPSPPSGLVNEESDAFTVTPNGPYSGTITITPSGGGLSDPAVLTFSNSSVAQTFTITPTSTGTVTLTPTNSGTLTDPAAVTYESGVSAGTVATPTFLAAGGTYDHVQMVTISSATESTTIYYTTDGSDPTESSTLYTGPVAVASSMTLKAIATRSGYTNSEIGSADYTITGTGQITFTTTGATFAPIIKVTGSPTVLWVFSDGTTSSSTTPSVNFGSAGTRTQILYVSPWSALTQINLGYDGADGGSTPSVDNIAALSQQNVSAIAGLSNVANYLTQFAASYNPITSLDFSNFVVLNTIECYGCTSLATIELHGTVLLSRLCLEDANLTNLDLSESPELADLRSAVQGPGNDNDFTIIWGSIGEHVWHICIRDNGNLTTTIPYEQMPALRELFTWNSGFTGTLETHSTNLTGVLVQSNNYTAANFAGQFPAGHGGTVNIYNNDLTSLDVSDDPGLANLNASYNQLDQAAIDSVLQQLDEAGRTDGTLDLRYNNGVPSATGNTYIASLLAKGWTVYAMSHTVTGPSSGLTGSASSNFTVTPNGVYDGTFTITPSGGGLDASDAITLTFDNSSTPQTFTITPTSAGTVTLVFTNNGGLTNPSNATYVSSDAATSYTLTAPSPASGNVNSASEDFTVTPNGVYDGTITITPSGGGLDASDAVTLTFDNSSTPQNFTITPTSAGTVTLTPTNSSTLTDPSAVTYTANAVATSYTLTAPSPASGSMGSASGNFTVTPNAAYTGTITITPSGGGLTTPITLTFSNSSTPQTFTITPTSAGTVTLTPTNSGALTNPSAVTYSALSTGKAITAFNFNSLSPAVTGTITEGSHTIALAVPYGTDVTSLTPTITITGSSVSPNTGVAQDFTDPVTYTVTAADASTQEYIVTVTVSPASDDATLSALSLSSGTLSPTFASGTTSYTASVANGISSLTLTPTSNESHATITVNGTSVTSGSASGSISLSVGSNTITVIVTAQDASTQTYTITVTRAEASTGGGGGGGGTTITKPTVNSTQITKIEGNTVTLSLSVTNASQMIFSDTSSFTGSWITYASSYAYTKKDNQQKIYMEFRSSTGGISSLISLDIPTSTNNISPILSPAQGTYANSVTVSITASQGAAIYYTTDTTTPTASSSLYTLPFAISKTTTVKAIAIKTGYDNSSISSATYTITTSSDPDSSSYTTGTLLKLSTSPKVYVIIDGKKKWISTPEVFEQLGYKWTDIKVITDSELSSLVDYEDNLIRQIGDYKVYLVVNGIKRHIPNPAIFLNYGFSWNDIKDVDETVINKYQNTYLIKESGKQEVYYVTNGVRKWIPNMDIFNSYNDKMEDVQIISREEMESYPVSSLIRLTGTADVYLIEGGIKKRIPNPDTFDRYKFDWNHIITVNWKEFGYYKDGGELK